MAAGAAAARAAAGAAGVGRSMTISGGVLTFSEDMLRVSSGAAVGVAATAGVLVVSAGARPVVAGAVAAAAQCSASPAYGYLSGVGRGHGQSGRVSGGNRFW
jgi:hypothetical protein